MKSPAPETKPSPAHVFTAAALATGLLFRLNPPPASGATEELDRGFRHHGVAMPISDSRGTVATADGQGHDVVLSWLSDHRGGYELLLLDASTGQWEEYALPFPAGDYPYASILSSRNKFYSHFNDHFVEFDPAGRAFTFCRKTAPRMAMSMTEDDRGVIWAATYPNCGLVSFNPRTRELKDHGSLNQENWAQYPRSMAADAAGWIYLAIGSTRGQIVMFDPATAKATALLSASERTHGYPQVTRDVDGQVYAQPNSQRPDRWLVLRQGQATPVGKPANLRPKLYIAGSQGLFHATFPDGKRLKTFDLVAREFTVEDPKTRTVKTFPFDYRSEGAHVLGLIAAPDGTVCGATAFPMRFFSFDPRQDKLLNRPAYGQWNTLARQGDRIFIGAYTGGSLMEWNPFKPWTGTRVGDPASNPLHLVDGQPTIIRPHCLLAHPDGTNVVMGGTPAYGTTGGGLLFWDRVARRSGLLTHEQVLRDQATFSLAPLAGGRLLGGTTTSPGTGGEKKAVAAQLYLMDLATKRITWHAAVLPGAQEYTALCPGPNGLVFGVADRERFFVFDPEKREVVYEANTREKFGPSAHGQGPRVFVRGRNGEVFALFARGIARPDLKTFTLTMLAESPVRIGSGGDYLDGRIYFASGSHVYSWKIAE
jgi:hypothetical protein